MIRRARIRTRSTDGWEAASSSRRSTNSSVMPIDGLREWSIRARRRQDAPGTIGFHVLVRRARFCNDAGRIMSLEAGWRFARSGSSAIGADRCGRLCTGSRKPPVSARSMPGSSPACFMCRHRVIRRSGGGVPSRRCAPRRSMRWSSMVATSRCSTPDDFRSRWRRGTRRIIRRSPSSCCGRMPNVDAAPQPRPAGSWNPIRMPAHSTVCHRGDGGWTGSACRRPRRSVAAAIRPAS